MVSSPPIQYTALVMGFVSFVCSHHNCHVVVLFQSLQHPVNDLIVTLRFAPLIKFTGQRTCNSFFTSFRSIPRVISLSLSLLLICSLLPLCPSLLLSSLLLTCSHSPSPSPALSPPPCLSVSLSLCLS